MPTREPFAGKKRSWFDEENLRLGTFRVYQSDWTLINSSATAEFLHQLDAVPWMVDVIRSETSDGKLPQNANGDVTVVRADSGSTRGTETTTITVTNDLSTAEYFQVRAF